MFANLPIGGDEPSLKPQTFQFQEINRLDLRLQHVVQNLIVTRKSGKHTPAIGLTDPDLFIIIFHPAVITTELLVSPAVTDLIPTLQAHSHLFSCYLIFHRLQIIVTNIFKEQIKTKGCGTEISFSNQSFSFFNDLNHHKINFMIHQINLCIPKKITS